jgi:hypothetical protein
MSPAARSTSSGLVGFKTPTESGSAAVVGHVNSATAIAVSKNCLIKGSSAQV